MKGHDFVSRRLDAFGRGDIDALVADYTDTAVIMTPMGNMTGGAQARQVITGWLQEFAMPGVTFEVLHRNCTDNVAHFSCKAETPKTSYRFGNGDLHSRRQRQDRHPYLRR